MYIYLKRFYEYDYKLAISKTFRHFLVCLLEDLFC